MLRMPGKNFFANPRIGILANELMSRYVGQGLLLHYSFLR